MEEKLKSYFLNLYHMSLSDTEVDPVEVATLRKIGEEKGITKEDIDNVILNSSNIKLVIPGTINEKISDLYDLARIAWADGRVDNNEKHLMQVFTKKFGFEEENVPEIVDFILDEVQKGTSKEDMIKIAIENI
jgi:uncharacterized tellurite resistance protein B-like protein